VARPAHRSARRKAARGLLRAADLACEIRVYGLPSQPNANLWGERAWSVSVDGRARWHGPRAFDLEGAEPLIITMAGANLTESAQELHTRLSGA